jgi:Spy/CpxP family protein refolding chaperone
MNPETRKKAGFWLVLVFLLGAAVGGVFGYSFAHHTHADTTKAMPAPSEPERRAKRVTEMTSELGLTSEQSAKVDAIIHETHDEIKVVRDKSEADVDGLRQKAREQIRAVLTSDQKPKFEVMVQRMDAERMKAQQNSGVKR